MGVNSLEHLFWPKSVAIVGASNNPGKAGHQILKTLVEEKFQGKIFAVNTSENEVFGLKCYKSLKDIPDRVEMVVISIPAPGVPDVMKQAAERGDVKAAIIVSAGFAETGIPERIELEKQVVEIAKAAGIRIVGPNCNGIINTGNRISTSFAPGLKMIPGSIGYFTQSGATGGSLLLFASSQPQPLGFSKWVHVGNMCDVTNLEVLEYYASDPSVKVIAGYMEGVRDGRELMKLADRITRQKPLLVLKVGRTEVGSSATLSHTGTLAGSDRIYSAAFAQSGIIRVNTIEELVDSAKALVLAPYPKGNRISVLTEAGGLGIIAMDELGSDPAVQLAPVTQETQEALAKVLPPMAMICKPNGYVDMTAAAMEKEFAESLRLLLKDPNVDAVILIGLPPTFLPAENVAKAIVEVARNHEKPVMVCFMTGQVMEDARKYLEESGIPTFDTPDRAARAMINLIKAASRLNYKGSKVLTLVPDKIFSHNIVKEAAREGRNLLEPEAVQVLEDFGIRMQPFYFAKTEEDAVAGADAIGYPVVLKVVSPQIIHKSDYGGVKLNLYSPEEVRQAYAEIISTVKRKAPDAEIKGVIVTPFMKGGTEVIVGMLRDPQFGPVVMFGLGGVFVEVFKDVSFRVAPFDRDEALKMIAETKAYTILRGARGSQDKDIDALADLLVKIGEIAVSNPEIKEMDLNPVAVFERGLAVLDVRIITEN
ncbi:acetyltransferase [Caldanaerovirga acetigignens]|uniref:Acetyltransferase n=1 Tax=Caldanaerovirga acetigignens TaxID=447595 RepID=A0A1M7LQ06_9FIRM|nr:acetyltransferase [Caldanaerovirga acetigignens]